MRMISAAAARTPQAIARRRWPPSARLMREAAEAAGGGVGCPALGLMPAVRMATTPYLPCPGAKAAPDPHGARRENARAPLQRMVAARDTRCQQAAALQVIRRATVS